MIVWFRQLCSGVIDGEVVGPSGRSGCKKKGCACMLTHGPPGRAAAHARHHTWPTRQGGCACSPSHMAHQAGRLRMLAIAQGKQGWAAVHAHHRTWPTRQGGNACPPLYMAHQAGRLRMLAIPQGKQGWIAGHACHRTGQARQGGYTCSLSHRASKAGRLEALFFVWSVRYRTAVC